jgi:hypothetical protein
MLSYSASEDEQRRVLPGDLLVPKPLAVWTRAITIEAPRASVWSWIAQLGADRGGWYAYDFLDNGGRPSATDILQKYQEVVIGQVIPALPGATDAFVVADVDPGRMLVLTVPGCGTAIVSWVFLLESVGKASTRLIVRARVSNGWRDLARSTGAGGRLLLVNRIYRFLARLPEPLMVLMGGIGHGVMEKRMLRGIKRRAEALSQKPR